MEKEERAGRQKSNLRERRETSLKSQRQAERFVCCWVTLSVSEPSQIATAEREVNLRRESEIWGG